MPRGAFAPAFALIRFIVYDLNLPLNLPVKDGIAAYHFMPSLKGQRGATSARSRCPNWPLMFITLNALPW